MFIDEHLTNYSSFVGVRYVAPTELEMMKTTLAINISPLCGYFQTDSKNCYFAFVFLFILCVLSCKKNLVQEVY